jgi:hypothetical protein
VYKVSSIFKHKKIKALDEVTASKHVQDILVEKWSSIFGKLSIHLSFYQYRKGLLTIESDNPMWVSEIDFYKTDILEKINTLIPKKSVYNLKILFNKKKKSINKKKILTKTDMSLESAIRLKNNEKIAEGNQLCTKCGKMYTKESLCIYCKLKPMLG